VGEGEGGGGGEAFNKGIIARFDPTTNRYALEFKTWAGRQAIFQKSAAYFRLA